MKKTDIWVRSVMDSKYLFYGDCFENELLEHFKNPRNWVTEEEKWFRLLSDYLKKEKGKKSDQDILHDIFLNKISLDYNFAEKLNLFDIVYPKCFTADGELGDAILKLCEIADMEFIVDKKTYAEKEFIKIDFFAGHSDSIPKLHRDLMTLTTKSYNT